MIFIAVDKQQRDLYEQYSSMPALSWNKEIFMPHSM